MLTALRWLALEAKYLEPARAFYEEALGLPVGQASQDEVVYAAGEDELVLRRASGVPRGGVHTHYAFGAPRARYDDWYDRLSGAFDLREHEFGSAKSLYLYDPDGNCVEIAGTEGSTEATDDSTGTTDDSTDPGDDSTDAVADQSDAADAPPIGGVFEVVLEVESLDRAESFYRPLGFDPVDRGDARRRVRLRGPVDLELWEPQLGIADARGGLHVDLGFEADPDRVVDAVGDRACEVIDGDDGVRVRDPDGHWLTIQ
ncbi:fosmidomycin resistance protein [Halobacteriales archaeon QS_1_68_20]|nr:MAG: fosmidomycin resistance protein [Halobacteriales archaeon QS_1_68_20]